MKPKQHRNSKKNSICLQILSEFLCSEKLIQSLIKEQYPASLEDICGHSKLPLKNDYHEQAGKVIELFKPQDRIHGLSNGTGEEDTFLSSERDRHRLANINCIKLCVLIRETKGRGGIVSQDWERRLFAVQMLLRDASVVRWMCEGLGLRLLAIIQGSCCDIVVFEPPSEDLVHKLNKLLVALDLVLATSASPDFWLELPQKGGNVHLVYLADVRANLDITNFDS